MYDFANLSPLDFEELIRDLLAAATGSQVEIFGPGKDRGVDCRFAVADGTAIVQAKHYLRSGAGALVQSLKKEDPKVARLAPSRYIIFTSVSLNVDWKEKIKAAMPHAPLKNEDIYGSEEINALLREHPNVEKAHFKLWLSSANILDRIIHAEIYNRTETELQSIEAMIPKFVQNESVDKAEEILKECGSLIISGHPGVGKTTLARMLTWLHAAQGWEIFVVDDISEAFKVALPESKRLIFFDDFLGQVRLSPDYVRGIDSRLPPLIDRVSAHANMRFVLTTRQYILSQAGLLAGRLANKTKDKKYVLDVGIYTRYVRARILYNHIYFSNLDEHRVNDLLEDEFYLKIVDHDNFNPRLIELLTNEAYASLTGDDFRAAVLHVLDNPNELWERPYRDHISDDGKALMIAVLLFPRSAPIDQLCAGMARAASALGAPIPVAQQIPRFRAALREIEGSVVQISDKLVSFSNPGVRDFLQVVVLEDQLVGPLVQSAETFREVAQCWAIEAPQRRSKSQSVAEPEAWVGALQRGMVCASSYPLALLGFCLDASAYHGTDKFIKLAWRFAKEFESEPVDPGNAQELTQVLRRLGALGFSEDITESIRDLLLEAAYSILENHADEMPFDDIELLDDLVHSFDDDPRRATSAVNTALNLFLREIGAEMDSFGSVEELDQFEERLVELTTSRTYGGKIPTLQIQDKREYLEYKETERYEDFEPIGGAFSANHSLNSNAHI